MGRRRPRERQAFYVATPVGGTAVDKVLVLRGEPSFTIQHDVRVDWERQQMAGLLDLITMFNLDPAAITLEHHTSSPVGNATIAVLKAVNAEAEKRAKAIDVEPVTSLPLGDPSVGGENAAQKEG